VKAPEKVPERVPDKVPRTDKVPRRPPTLEAQPKKNLFKMSLSPHYCTGGSPIVRHCHTKRDVTGPKWASIQTQSPAFMSTYVEWRNSRLEALQANRKVDRRHKAMVNDNIWHRWFLAGLGTEESETMISRSALAHIYDNVKAKTAGGSPSVGSTKRSPLGLQSTRSSRIQTRYLFLVN
jgi:hypothetical protein